MCYAELKRWDTADFPAGQKAPDDSNDFELLILAEIGPSDRAGADWFDVWVMTPTWIMKQLDNQRLFWGRNCHIVARWDLDAILGSIRDLRAAAFGPDWKMTAAYLSRFGMWEYEQFRLGPDLDGEMPQGND